MKIGIVSDIHGNAAALEKALCLMGETDELVCLGDSISQYKFSNETIGLLYSRKAHVIWGNHEEVFFSEAGKSARSAPWIDQELLVWLQMQPTRKLLTWLDQSLLLVHSTPWPSGSAYVCPHHSEFRRFAEAGTDYVLYGHTHFPAVEKLGRTVVINPGSVGEHRYVDGLTELSCAVLDLESRHVTKISFS